jgi:hypothetical protein
LCADIDFPTTTLGEDSVHQDFFDRRELGIVNRASKRAARLVSDYYRVAPREWLSMPYEVRTLRSLDSSEVTDEALAQTVCYAFKRQAGSVVVKEGDLFRICLQDHRILGAARDLQLGLRALLTHVLTHELVHVVRFGQRLQSVDLAQELRSGEERKVERTTRTILASAGESEIDLR